MRRLTDPEFDAIMERLSAHSADGGGWWVEAACRLADDRAALLDRATAEWTCPHGSTHTGSDDFVSGVRNAHLEIEGWANAAINGRSLNDIAYDILQAAPQVEELVEEWFATTSKARIREFARARKPPPRPRPSRVYHAAEVAGHPRTVGPEDICVQCGQRVDDHVAVNMYAEDDPDRAANSTSTSGGPDAE